MLFLPELPGRFPVGATTFITPVRSPRTVGSFKLRSQSDAPQSALYLEEVAFTAYYPANISNTTRKGLNWLIRPVKESLRGLAHFSNIPHWVLWPIVYLFGSLIKIPVYPNAPLARPVKVSSNKAKVEYEQWPLVIFSHGLGGSRTAYSQICSRLATSGKVVLAMEHRDGTGCVCIRRVRNADGTHGLEPMLYYKEHDVVLDNTKDQDNATPLPLRTDQLEFRREEIYTAYQTFSQFLQNDPSSELGTIDNSQIDSTSWSYVDPTSGKGPVCFEANVSLAGHSFGGCTVLSILSTEPPPKYLHIPATHALVLDPWLEPLATPGPAPLAQTLASLSHNASSLSNSTGSTSSAQRTLGGSEVKDHSLPAMLVINSETFTLWKDHYTRLEDVISAWEPHGQRILTLVASRHTDFSDFPLLPVIRTAKAKKIMDVFSKLSIAFLEGQLEQELEKTSTRKMDIEIAGKKKDGRPKRKLVGAVGDVVIA
ncbi:hypothetical protein DXG03_000263 [Asterophora parasitica]|uniref:1-alkyl-2-acetylglycerophosphocholine esterase n=1 Tax=Asterophora parasitica TaxID=117018 RepID=A0A9P7KGR2_9AGAR|nr:hypothetical protein DXG03_000263 [Asterophora parasitica]